MEVDQKAEARAFETPQLYRAFGASGVTDDLDAETLHLLHEYSITTVEEILGIERVDRQLGTSLLNDVGVSPQLVGIAIPLYRSWMRNPVVRKYGNITMPLPGEVRDRIGHAVTLVGFQDDDDFAGGGFFIVRNSWDHHWASQSLFGSGYGTIPYAYIARHNWDAWCIIK